jgi:hypothetical protein
VPLRADLQHFVNLNVGVAARLGNLELKIEGVEAQGLFMARLDNVSRLLGRVLTTLDRNPALLESVGRSIENVGGGARGALEGGGGAPGALGRRGREAASRNGGYPKSRRARPHPTRDGPPGGEGSHPAARRLPRPAAAQSGW